MAQNIAGPKSPTATDGSGQKVPLDRFRGNGGFTSNIESAIKGMRYKPSNVGGDIPAVAFRSSKQQ